MADTKGVAMPARLHTLADVIETGDVCQKRAAGSRGVLAGRGRER